MHELMIPYAAYIAVRFRDEFDNVMHFVFGDGDPVLWRAGDRLNQFMWGDDKKISVSVEVKLYRDITEARKDPFIVRGPLQSKTDVLEKENIRKQENINQDIKHGGGDEH